MQCLAYNCWKAFLKPVLWLIIVLCMLQLNEKLSAAAKTEITVVRPV